VVFLLDVLEHIPEDLEAMMQVKRALKPGGLLFVTTPALKAFWSYNDDAAHHVRRYSQTDFYQLAQDAGLECCDCRYFMFFLSPLPWLARQRHPDFSQMNQQEILEFYKHTHDVPVAPLNWLLMVIFACETPLGLWKKFPWGTSVLGVFRRPA
jgi:SAM-dependent methyltransferase